MTVASAAFKYTADGSNAIAEILRVKSATQSLDSTNVSGLTSKFKALGTEVAGALAIGALVGFAKSALEAADAIGDAAERAGIAVESMSRLKYVAEQNDVAFESLVSGITKFQKLLSNAETGNKAAIETLERFGVSAQQLKGLKFEDQLALLSDGFRKNTDASYQTRTAIEAFGKAAGPEFVILLNSGSESMKAFAQQADDLGLTLDKQTAEAADKATKKIEELWNRLQTFTARGAADVITGVEDLAKAFAHLRFGADNPEQKLAEEGKALGEQRKDLLEQIERDKKRLTAGGSIYRSVVQTQINEAQLEVTQIETRIKQILDIQMAGIEQARRNAAAAKPAANQDNFDLSEVVVNTRQRDPAAEFQKRLTDEVNQYVIDQQAKTITTEYQQRKAADDALQALFKQNDEDSQKLLQESNDRDLAQLERFNQRQLDIDRQYFDQQKKDQQDWLRFKQQGYEAAQDLLTAYGGRYKSFAQVILAFQKAEAIAGIIVDTQKAASKALATYGYPLGVAAAAGAIAFGALRIAAVASTFIGSNNAPSLGSPGNPVFTSPSSSTGSTNAAADAQKNTLQVFIQGDVFSSKETVDWLMEQLQDQLNNRDAIIINRNSRQAQELVTP